MIEVLFEMCGREERGKVGGWVGGREEDVPEPIHTPRDGKRHSPRLAHSQ